MERSKKEDQSAIPRWEWRLRGGQRVAATLDTTTNTETVFVEGNVASQAVRGTKPEGHAVTVPSAPSEERVDEPVVVTFDPRLVICLLRVGRDEVTPQQWPGRQRGKTLDPAPRPFPLGIVVVALLAAAAVGGGSFVVKHLLRAPSSERGVMAGVHRAESGLFVAHFPLTFESRPPVLPPGASGLVLEDRKKEEAIVIVALALPDGLRDPWALQTRAHGEALANLPRGGGPHVETARSDGTCLGQPGAVVIGRVTNPRGAPAAVWSCALFRGGDGYLVMYALGETASAADAARLRSIVDATELTRLASMTTP